MFQTKWQKFVLNLTGERLSCRCFIHFLWKSVFLMSRVNFIWQLRDFDQPRKQRLRNPEVIGSDPVVGYFLI